MWAAAAAEVTCAGQLVPEGQARTTAPDSLTMSMYQGVGPTSRAVVAVSVTAVPGAADAALAASPVRQTPSVEQLPLPLAGVLVEGTGVYVDVLVGGTGVLVKVLVADTGVYVAVLVGGSGVLVAGMGVLVAGTGVFVAWIGVLVAGAGVLVRVLVAGIGVLVGMLVAGAMEDQVTATGLLWGPPPEIVLLLVLSQAV